MRRIVWSIVIVTISRPGVTLATLECEDNPKLPKVCTCVRSVYDICLVQLYA